jgi:hypothetical protein
LSSVSLSTFLSPLKLKYEFILHPLYLVPGRYCPLHKTWRLVERSGMSELSMTCSVLVMLTIVVKKTFSRCGRSRSNVHASQWREHRRAEYFWIGEYTLCRLIA